MKTNETIRILEDIVKEYEPQKGNESAIKRVFEKAIAALKYCEEQGLTYYIEEKRYGKIENTDKVTFSNEKIDYSNLVGSTINAEGLQIHDTYGGCFENNG